MGKQRLLSRVSAFLRRILHRPTTIFSIVQWCVHKYILRRRFLAKRVLGNIMLLDLQQEGISRALAFYGIREPSHTQWIRENVKEGMVVLDLGANIGYYALIEASLVGKSGRVYAIEPDPRNVELLNENIRANGLGGIIEVHQLAISDTDGRARLVLGDRTNLSALATRDRSERTARSLEVRTASVDTFLRGKRRPDVLRMDVEGGEVEVLNGMPETLECAKPGFKIFFELHQDCYSERRSMRRTLRRLFDNGYAAKLVVAYYGVRFDELGYGPARFVRRLGSTEYVYENVREEDVIELACQPPQRARYLLLEKVAAQTRQSDH